MSEVITDETMLCVIFERAKEVEKAAFETRRNLERSWGMEWIDYHNAETIAAERLTGVTWKQIESEYAYEANTGVFEFGWILPKYYEGLRFGTWVTDEFVQWLERGHFEIDESNPEYQEYLKKKMELTIELISEKYPEEMKAAGIYRQADVTEKVSVGNVKKIIAVRKEEVQIRDGNKERGTIKMDSITQ